MKAYQINKYSKNESLKLAEVSLPELRDDDVLVEVQAAGLNVLDSKIKSGEFKLLLPYKLPLVLGHDVAGVITKVGRNVTQFKIGDEVYSRPSDGHIGAFAEFIAIQEKDVALKPKNISMEEAASLPLVSLTAWQAMEEQIQLKKGQKIFIQAGSGGVGTIAIQLAKYFGATVATTAGRQSFEMVKSLGADIAIDYKNQDFETLLKDYDAVLNSQDTSTLQKSLNILKKGGKAISISGPPTPEFAKQIGAPWYVKLILTLISKGIRKRAKSLGVNYTFLFMRAEGGQLKKISQLVESGVIRPVVDRVFPFEKTNEALEYIESGRAKGKVVVKLK